MAIQPQYSQAILAGTKRVEFRKRALASDINRVLIYESAPTQRVVGVFTIERAVRASPNALWSGYNKVGSIQKEHFDAYYEGVAAGVALIVSDVQAFELPIELAELPSQPAIPQSFVYLPAADLDVVLQRQLRTAAGRRKNLVTRVRELVAG